MSHQNRAPNASSEDRADAGNAVDVVLADTLAVSLAGGSDNAAADALRQSDPPPTLPTGAVIDGKNTLQSFERRRRDPPATVRSPEIEPDGPVVHPTLHNGQVITGKNTLRTFDDTGREMGERTPVDPPDDVADELKSLPYDQANPNVATAPPSTTAIAVAVGDIVYAELAPEPDPSTSETNHNENHNAPSTAWYKNRSTFVLMTIILLLLAVVLGVSIGLSNNGSSNETFKTIPTSPPIAIDPNLAIWAAVLTSYINNITLTNQTITADASSPESKALSWLIYNDTTLNTTAVIREDDPISRTVVGFRIQQRYSLLVMWFQQEETTKWAITSGWLVESSECAWYGIVCGSIFVDFNEGPFHGDYQNAIIQISFDLIGSYVGIIPAEIGLLTNLQYFKIVNTSGFIPNGRYLQGSLPYSIGQLTALTYFNVAGNNLNGTIPDCIDQWTTLSYFAVAGNPLTGTLPHSIGRWTGLTHFDASYSYLKGTLPEIIGQWTVLTYFDISHSAGLTGTLPDSIGQWTALTYFEVYNINGLFGTIPSSIGNWSLIQTAKFYKNQFMGTMPNAICQYVDPATDVLQVDCTVNCSCCTADCL
jgi:hypothetical protein